MVAIKGKRVPLFCRTVTKNPVTICACYGNRDNKHMVIRWTTELFDWNVQEVKFREIIRVQT